MKKENRLTCHQDFRAVYKNGRLTYGRYVAVHFLPIDSDEIKIGISVSKKVGNAVVRNGVKRKIRAILAEIIDELPPKHFIVIGAKVKSKNANYGQLKRDFMDVLKGSGMKTRI